MATSGRRAKRVGPTPDGYVSGPAAATEATAEALARLGEPATVILVEGVSDQIALETLARGRGRDLHAVGAAVVPTGGAHAIGQFAVRFGPAGPGLRIIALCDAGEEAVVRRAVACVSDRRARVRVPRRSRRRVLSVPSRLNACRNCSGSTAP